MEEINNGQVLWAGLFTVAAFSTVLCSAALCYNLVIPLLEGTAFPQRSAINTLENLGNLDAHGARLAIGATGTTGAQAAVIGCLDLGV